MEIVLNVKNIKKSFSTDFWKPKSEVLKDISFQLERGKCTGFLGINGAGKTTLIKIILGLIKSDSGEIKINIPLSQIGFVPERPQLTQSLTGKELIHYMGKLSKMSYDEIEKMSKKWAQRLKINDSLDMSIRNYSKGMVQRLVILSSLIHNPDLLILDEPLSGLDPIGRKEIKDIIRELKLSGKTIFICSHIIQDLEDICENIVLLKNGNIKYSGSVSNLLSKYESNDMIIHFKENDILKTKTIKKELLIKILTTMSENKIEILKVINSKDSLEKVIFENNIDQGIHDD